MAFVARLCSLAELAVARLDLRCHRCATGAQPAGPSAATWRSAMPRRPRAEDEGFDGFGRGPIPFVAALQGAVVGGGLELAMAAHVRVCDRSAVFGLPEGQRG